MMLTKNFTDDPDEVFKEIPNTKGLYWISNKGRLWFTKEDRLCNWQRALPHGYLQTLRRFKSHTVCMRAHVLVAELFISPRPEGMDINHIDGDKENNQVGNLEYVTHRYNINHARRLGLINTIRGESIGGSVLKDSDILPILELYHQGWSYERISHQFKSSPTAIRGVVSGTYWSHIPRPEHLSPDSLVLHRKERDKAKDLDRFMVILELLKTCATTDEIAASIGISKSAVYRAYKRITKKGIKCKAVI